MKMNLRKFLVCIGIALASTACVAALLPATAQAEIFGAVHGIVHDPQHRPIQDADVDLKAQRSDWAQHQKTNGNGEFEFSAVPLGEYTVTVTIANFQPAVQSVVVTSGSNPVLHFPMALAPANEKTVVTAEPVGATTDSLTPTTLLSRQDVPNTPGAYRTHILHITPQHLRGPYI